MSNRSREIFWEDHDRDMQDPEYRQAYLDAQNAPVYEYTLRWPDGKFYSQIFASRLDAMEIVERYAIVDGPRILKRPRRDKDWKDDE